MVLYSTLHIDTDIIIYVCLLYKLLHNYFKLQFNSCSMLSFTFFAAVLVQEFKVLLSCCCILRKTTPVSKPLIATLHDNMPVFWFDSYLNLFFYLN